MNGWKVAAALLVAANVALVACRGSTGGPSFGDGGPCPNKTPPAVPSDADMTVEELTDLVAEAITCPGYAFHMRSVGQYEAGPYSSYSETEAWIDMQRGVGRVEQLFRITSDEALAEAATAEAEADDEEYGLEFRSTGISLSDGRYSSRQDEEQAEKGSPSTCHGPGREALWLVLPCFDGPLQDFEISIDPNGSYNGREAIAFVAEGESSGSDETYYTTRHMFFDSETLLPLSVIVEGTLDIGEIHPVQSDIPFEHEFVPLDSLPLDFFDPASIGYVEPDPAEIEEPLDRLETVYWLGREFEGSDEYPALALYDVFSGDIMYRPADDEFGRIYVSISQMPWTGAVFPDPGRGGDRCNETVEVEVEGARGFVIRKYHERTPSGSECPPHDRFAGEVHFENMIVEIDAPSTGTRRGTIRSPYDSEEAMELLIRGLELRE